ncbi:hypothetical protein [Paenibacillus sp. JDR-2]|uniref:hypothetical protein n=1 Tax=Paenibacillus sp. (strain JDR-2) TaxID=324057 RepID=UPI000166AF70|nr:hypothetical protein [Paenibacillus sp. JDR-2]ACS99109.1 hypothetical protein Pjdr2_0429 [Paenibacillus sp. JDR-2]
MPVRSSILRLLFIASGACMTALLTLRGSAVNVLIGLLCSLLLLYWLTYKRQVVEKVTQELSPGRIFFAALFTLVGVYYLTQYSYIKYSKLSGEVFDRIGLDIGGHNDKVISIALGICSLLAVFLVLCWFLPKFYATAKELITGLDRLERRYWIIASIIMAVAILIIYNLTNVFYGAHDAAGKIIPYDVVYTADSIDQVESNAFLNIGTYENDIRQPLFGLYAAPFALIAMILSKVLFFIPNSYPIMMQIIHVFVMQFAMILLARMMKLQSMDKVFFLLFMSFSYPFLLFMLNIEQYIFAVFWLILFIYSYLFQWGRRDFFFIGAVGSLVTTGILFPLLSQARKLKEWIKDMAVNAFKFLAAATLFGQLPVILETHTEYKGLMAFSGAEVTTLDKWYQYVNFFASCFVWPSAGEDRTTFEHASYQLRLVDSLNILGVIILVLAVIGFLLHYKDRFAQICMFWLAFSFVILFAVGWGTKENGLILYSFYYSWALFALIFKLANRLLARVQPLKFGVYGLLLGVMAVINLIGIYDLIDFGIRNYPA